jgi:hypothetical protein
MPVSGCKCPGILTIRARARVRGRTAVRLVSSAGMKPKASGGERPAKTRALSSKQPLHNPLRAYAVVASVCLTSRRQPVRMRAFFVSTVARDARDRALSRVNDSRVRNTAGVRLIYACPTHTPGRTSRQESPGDPAVRELRAIDGPGRYPNGLLPVPPLRRMLARLERTQTQQDTCRHLSHSLCGPVGCNVRVAPTGGRSLSSRARLSAAPSVLVSRRASTVGTHGVALNSTVSTGREAGGPRALRWWTWSTRPDAASARAARAMPTT